MRIPPSSDPLTQQWPELFLCERAAGPSVTAITQSGRGLLTLATYGVGPTGRSPYKQKEKTMIFHINLFTPRPGLSDEQLEKGLDLMRQSGANPAVKSYVVGRELGGEFEYGAAYVVEDLDGYWAYLEFPAHVRLELWGIPYLEKFAAIDVCDSEDPEIGKKIAALQARHQQEHPEIAALIAEAASSFTVPDGKGSAA